MKTTPLTLWSIVLCLCLAMPVAVWATPQSRPNGPYVEVEQQYISLAPYMTQAELIERLQTIEATTNGIVELEIAGYSDAVNGDLMEPLGWPLYLAKLGSGDIRVLVTTQIHGDEFIGTEVMCGIMEALGTGDEKAMKILDNITLWVMPRVNPDGAMNEYEGDWYPDRQTHQVWDPEAIGLPAGTPSPWYYDSIGYAKTIQDYPVIHGNPGYDANRDTNPNLDFRIENLADYGLDPKTFAVDYLGSQSKNNSRYGGYFVTPEARIITSVFNRLQPDVFIDIHHRGFNVLSDEDNRQVYLQIAAEVADPYTDPFTGNDYEVDADVLELAKQVNLAGYLALQLGNSPFGAIQRYPQVNLPGTTLGAFALNDTAIMLIEIAGQTHNIGAKAHGRFVKATRTAMDAILEQLADGSIREIDASLYEEIPEAANRISDPTVRDDLF